MDKSTWNPDDWDISFCKEMVGYLKHDLEKQLSPRMTELRAKMCGMTTEEFIKARNEDLENKIQELQNRIGKSK